jgi:hypothetical protein
MGLYYWEEGSHSHVGIWTTTIPGGEEKKSKVIYLRWRIEITEVCLAPPLAINNDLPSPLQTNWDF